MTAARTLHIVADLADSPPQPPARAPQHTRDADDAAGRADTIADHWEPENQLIGALMWLPATRVRPILELVPPTAIWRPINRWIYELIAAVIDEGRDPDPVTVLARGQRQPAADALAPHQMPTAEQNKRLALRLADLYTHTVTPAGAPSYARDVLDDAYRRAFAFHGIRMQQFAQSNAERDELTTQFGLIRDELADLWRRCQTAAAPGWERTRPAPTNASR